MAHESESLAETAYSYIFSNLVTTAITFEALALVTKSDVKKYDTQLRFLAFCYYNRSFYCRSAFGEKTLSNHSEHPDNSFYCYLKPFHSLSNVCVPLDISMAPKLFP